MTKIERILMNVIQDNGLLGIDGQTWEDVDAFKSGNMSLDEAKKFLRVNEGDSMEDIMSTYLYRELLYDIDRGELYDINKEMSYEEFLDKRSAFIDGEMTEREIKDFLVECNVADPSDYARGWYYSSDDSLDISSESIVRGGIIDVEMKEYDHNINCYVDKDGIHDGKVSVRVSNPYRGLYGKRLEVPIDSIRGNLGYTEGAIDELEALEEAEKYGTNTLFANDGTVLGSVVKGWGIDFGLEGENVHGVITEDSIHDGKISVAAITKNYSKRYEIPKEDVTDIVHPDDASPKRRDQYALLIMRLDNEQIHRDEKKYESMNKSVQKMLTQAVLDAKSGTENTRDDADPMYGFVAKIPKNAAEVDVAYLQQVLDDVAGIPEDDPTLKFKKRIHMFDMGENGNDGNKLCFVGCDGYGNDVKSDIANTVMGEMYAVSVDDAAYTKEMQNRLVEIEEFGENIRSARALSEKNKKDYLNTPYEGNEKLNEGLVSETEKNAAEMQMQ